MRSLSSRPRLEDIAKVVGMSRWHFHRRFKAHFGETPSRALVRHQLEESKRLMLAGEPLTRVARRTGFLHQSHFSTRFKRETGKTPTQWLGRRRG